MLTGYKNILLLLLLLMNSKGWVFARQPFTEGFVNYAVKLVSADGKAYEGSFSITVKNGKIRKELQLNNGFTNVMLINCVNNTAHSLKTINGKHYAIQHRIADIQNKQDRFVGFILEETPEKTKIIAGILAKQGYVTYKDSTREQIYYTTDWHPEQGITYDKFPNAQFLPLSYAFYDEAGSVMHLVAQRVSNAPVEEALFRIPSDYKMISNEEFKQLNR